MATTIFGPGEWHKFGGNEEPNGSFSLYFLNGAHCSPSVWQPKSINTESVPLRQGEKFSSLFTLFKRRKMIFDIWLDL